MECMIPFTSNVQNSQIYKENHIYSICLGLGGGGKMGGLMADC